MVIFFLKLYHNIVLVESTFSVELTNTFKSRAFFRRQDHR